MTELMNNEVIRLALWVYGAMIILGPIVLRLQFKYAAKVDPQLVPFESLPLEVRNFMAPRVPGIKALGFEPVGYVNVGGMASRTKSFMALFSNPKTLEWADVSVVTATNVVRGYIEFITRCTEDVQVDTNTNAIAPVLFPSPTYHVFRFPQIKDAFVLYKAHRMLVQEKTRGARPQLPSPGQEVAELKRRLERFGPRQQEQGYMVLDDMGQFYRLTWKGAILGAWRSIWPISLVRRWRMQVEGESRLRALGVAQ
jgi:hypothetical protein